MKENGKKTSEILPNYVQILLDPMRSRQKIFGLSVGLGLAGFEGENLPLDLSKLGVNDYDLP